MSGGLRHYARLRLITGIAAAIALAVPSTTAADAAVSRSANVAAKHKPRKHRGAHRGQAAAKAIGCSTSAIEQALHHSGSYEIRCGGVIDIPLGAKHLRQPFTVRGVRVRLASAPGRSAVRRSARGSGVNGRGCRLERW